MFKQNNTYSIKLKSVSKLYNMINTKIQKIKIWAERWFNSYNAKHIGKLYLMFALFSGPVGTAFLVLIIFELSGPGVQFIGDNQLYNSIITAHVIVMIFFVVMPALIGGFGNFLLPLIVGSPYMAYPRLNNISFWLLIPSLILFLFANGIENGVGTGWTLYPFLSGNQIHSGPGVYLEVFALHLSGISSLIGLINFITTILNMRTIGIRLSKLSLYGWAIIVTAMLLLFLLPIITSVTTMILTDKNFTAFFEIKEGSIILYLYIYSFINFIVFITIFVTFYENIVGYFYEILWHFGGIIVMICEYFVNYMIIILQNMPFIIMALYALYFILFLVQLFTRIISSF